MTETQPLLERLAQVDAALEQGDSTAALSLLVEVRESGFVNRELDQHIDWLRGDDPDVDRCRKWISSSIDQVKQFGGDVFRDVEDLGEASMGFDKGAWVDVEPSANGDFNLFDDMDDLLDMSNLSGESETRDRFNESTRAAVDASDVIEVGLEEPSIGAKFREKSGRFPLPDPSSKSQKVTKRVSQDDQSNRETAQVESAPKTRDFELEFAPGDSDFDDPFADLSEESDVRELTPLRGVKAVQEEEEPVNPFADLMDLEDDEPSPPLRRHGFDSGASVARYAGVEPPPPTHRLKGGSAQPAADFSFDVVDDEPEPDPPSEEFDFDLGLANPNAAPPAKPFGDVSVQSNEVESDDDDFDFDLGLANPNQSPARNDAESTKPNDAKNTKPNDASRTKPGDEEKTSQRVEQPTPMGISMLSEKSDPIDEDEFFSIAESLAQESSAADSSSPGSAFGAKEANPFAHSAPTGVRHGAIEESSFVLEEASAAASVPVGGLTATNLSAILMEARRMYEQGDFAAALDVCEKVLSRGENAEAGELKAAVEGELERVQLEKLGSLAKVPELAISLSDLSTKDLDHRAGYLISQIDGMMAFEDLLELSSMSRLETLRVLGDLLDQGIIRET